MQQQQVHQVPLPTQQEPQSGSDPSESCSAAATSGSSNTAAGSGSSTLGRSQCSQEAQPVVGTEHTRQSVDGMPGVHDVGGVLVQEFCGHFGYGMVEPSKVMES